MNYAELIISYNDNNKDEKILNLDSVNQLLINKEFLKKSNFNISLIYDISIKIKCKDFFQVIINNAGMKVKHYGITSYADCRSSIAILKLYNIGKIHINDLDINHIETEKSSPLIVGCKINELYTGCEIHKHICNDKDDFQIFKYKVDIRRDTKINHLSGKGKYDLNIQESSIKQLSALNLIHKGHNINFVERFSVWNGSAIINLTLSAITEYFEIKNSTIENLTIGKSHVKVIKLQNETIEKCLIVNESIDSDDIDKWKLVKRSAIQNGDRVRYLKASYMINKKYTELEKQWLRKLQLKAFSIVCGYGYKPLRTIVLSISVIIFFGMLYWIISIILPNSFYSTSISSVDYLHFIDYIYYSGITYTTTGYGDIFPVNGLVRILSILEAITGVSVLSLFIFSLTKSLTGYAQK